MKTLRVFLMGMIAFTLVARSSGGGGDNGNAGQAPSAQIGVTTTSGASLTNGTTYYDIVTAANSSGESVESAQVSTAPTAGVSWIISTIDSTGDVGKHTSIAVDANKKVHISYYDSTNQTLKYATNSSGSWVATTVASAPSTAYGTSIAIDTNGKAHIGYEGTGGNLMYATNSSGNWVTTVLESSAWSDDVSIALDSNNKVHISYFNLVAFDLKYATNASGTWQSSIVVNGGAAGPLPGYSTSIGVDSNNKIHISYYDDASPDSIKYVTNISGSWVVTTIGTIGLAAGWKTSLAVDSNNKVHISYYDWTNDALKYASNASGSWQTEIVDQSSGGVYDASLAIDKVNGNQVHMVYGSYSGFKYARKSAGAWQISIIDESYTGSYNSIAIGSSSIHASYYDGSNLNLKYASKYEASRKVDFNGDGKEDILWRNYSTGQNVVWYLGGYTASGAALVDPVTGSLTRGLAAVDMSQSYASSKVYRDVAEVGGFSGQPVGTMFFDPLSKHENWDITKGPDRNGAYAGQMFSSPETGPIVQTLGVLSYSYLPAVTDVNWAMAGTGDFNGDGKIDIIWRNTSTGQNLVWYMNGIANAGYSYLTSVTDLNWQIAGTGDFNGDGQTDILWRNYSTGQNTVWYMTGATYTGYVNLLWTTDVNWQIVGTGDFDVDGKVDILWRNNSTGQNIVWFMNGATYASYAYLSAVTDVNWKIVGTGDFNGDGKVDIIWRNTSTGQNVVWYMNGTTNVSYDYLLTVADIAWRIANH